jgi:hypothetical protein
MAAITVSLAAKYAVSTVYSACFRKTIDLFVSAGSLSKLNGDFHLNNPNLPLRSKSQGTRVSKLTRDNDFWHYLVFYSAQSGLIFVEFESNPKLVLQLLALSESLIMTKSQRPNPEMQHFTTLHICRSTQDSYERHHLGSCRSLQLGTLAVQSARDSLAGTQLQKPSSIRLAFLSGFLPPCSVFVACLLYTLGLLFFLDCISCRYLENFGLFLFNLD